MLARFGLGGQGGASAFPLASTIVVDNGNACRVNYDFDVYSKFGFIDLFAPHSFASLTRLVIFYIQKSGLYT